MDSSKFIVTPGKTLRLRDTNPSYKSEFKSKEDAEQKLQDDIAGISAQQDMLYAQGSRALLLIFQAMDASGKDGAIKHVMSGINPQGCNVVSFKSPSSEELDHDYLWRCARELPRKGRIGIFNRSYYEEVLVVKVHPELLRQEKLPAGSDKHKFWKERYREINEFENYLVRNGTLILKFFLHLSKEEQKKRFLQRIENPNKNWKFSLADVKEREHWEEYMGAYEEMLSHTSTQWAPWYIIPADKKWFTRVAIADILLKTMKSMDLSYPKVDKERKTALETIRRTLLREK